MRLSLLALALVTTLNPAFATPNTSDYDLVISQGRVIDPETQTDAVLNIGIRNGRIATLSEETLNGEREIDATDKIVGPGFIDLHTHSGLPFGALLQLRDGVTTALDLEAGAFPASEYGNFIKAAPYLNYGASVAHFSIRMKVIEGREHAWLIGENGAIVPGAAFFQQPTDAEVEQMRELLHQGLDDGGLGIGFLLDYMSPAVSDAEMRMIFEVAAERDAPIWAHIRRGVNGDIQPLHDVLDVAIETGAPLHISHINANAMGEIGNWMKVIDEANKHGADVTMEIFPYTAGSTSISADVFNRDWKTIFNISYEDVQWAETGEFFTEETWYKTREARPDGMVVHHYMKEEWLREAMVHPEMMIATDAMPSFNAETKAAPNGAGSYTRLLSEYVRDEKVISLSDAFMKGSYLPARRLEQVAPVFKRKGRIQEGADADLLIFDIDNIKSNSAYTNPFAEATGYDYIMIEGEIVIDNDDLTLEAPGRQLLGTTL
ncbi:amidohydrolase family protein [Thaumasiovibrio subtropicus]|uniref:amidohydrolase family protein n=1 Tax=Thaumasiovibrio subtropicus TaxID=1891207 RepID=UPI000B34BDCE|nr:amidohydrolase family protein [Thaumasiovibrio subtropicus]